MFLFLKILQICFITTIIQEASNYVLLAADLEDFRTIAKKFVPDELADELAQIASQSATKQKQPTYDSYYSDDYSEHENDETQTVTAVQKTIRNRNNKRKLKNQEELPRINISEVVEKVKERLASEYANKYENTMQNKQLYVHVPNKKKNRQNEDSTRHTVRTTREYKKLIRDTAFNSKRTKDQKVTTQYYNKWNDKESEFDKTNVKVEKEIDDNEAGKDEPYEAIDLMKTKDSYEDYVMPKKEDIFESAETTKKVVNLKPKETRFVKVKNKPETLSKLKKIGDKRIRSKKRTTPNYDYEDEEKQEEKHEVEIKARTESLLFDERHQKADIGGQAEHKGTIIPKRDLYKLSSPTYSTFPNVAEKYDFNEPIPEKDREPENYNPVGKPSVLVNKKITLV